MKKIILLVIILGIAGIGFFLGYLRSSSNQSSSPSSSKPQTNSPGKGTTLTIPENAITKETTMIVSPGSTNILFDNDGFGRKVICTIQVRSRDTVFNSFDDKKGEYLAEFMIHLKLISSDNTNLASPNITSMENQKFSMSVNENPTKTIDKPYGISVEGLAKMTSDNQINLNIKSITW